MEIDKVRERLPKTSEGLKLLIKQRMEETHAIQAVLTEHGQHVAAAQMDDANAGLRKTIGCWNKSLEW